MNDEQSTRTNRRATLDRLPCEQQPRIPTPERSRRNMHEIKRAILKKLGRRMRQERALCS